VRVHLNPDDAQLVRNALPQAEQDGGWSISEDPLIGRGGCRLSTETSRIDATLEARLAALAATMLGGARGND
jgi:flagellar assembly protein FliH